MSVSATTLALLLALAPPVVGETTPIAAIAPPAAGELVHVEAPPVAPPVVPVVAPPVSSETAAPEAEDDAIVVSGERHRAPPGDPLEVVNAKSYAITQSVDKALVGPAAKTYGKVVPAPVRSGLRNFFNNLAEPIVFLNYLLQIKPGKAAETFGRFAINSTIGAAGLFDIAKRRPFKLPRRSNGFANTLGYYGVKPGAFLFLPLVGPTTVRDFIGLGLDKLVLPTSIGAPFDKPYYTITASIIGSIDYREQFDEQLKKIQDSADPYAASRENYLKNRQAEIDALHHRKGRGEVPAVIVPPLPAPDATPAPEADLPVPLPPEGAPVTEIPPAGL